MVDHGTPLVGRDPEIAVLHEALRRCAAGGSSLTVLQGEAGIGKSALLARVADEARDLGLPRLRGTFLASEQDLPLAALRRGLAQLPEPLASRTRLEALLHSSTGRDIRYQVVENAIEAILDVVERLQPVVFLMEDAHWADPESLQVMRAVARRTADRGVATVVTTRPMPRPPGLVRFIEHPALSARVLHLGPLHTAAVAELVRARTGGGPGPRLWAQLDRAGGNCLLLAQLLDEVVREGLLEVVDEVADLVDGAAPGALDLGGHVAGRLDAMGAAARQVVTLVALADLTAAQVAALLGTTVAAAGPAIQEALEDGIVVAAGDRLRLHHDLLRDAVLARQPAPVLAGLHADLSRLLAAEGADLLRIAPHLIASGGEVGGAGPDDLAVVAEAGRGLLGSAPAVAATLLRRAMDGGVPGVAVDLAFALILLGDAPGAARLVDHVGEGEQPVRVALAKAQVDFLQGDLSSAATGFESVAARLQAGPRQRIALADAAISRMLIGQLDRAQQLALAAAVADPAPDDRGATGTGMIVRGWVAAMRGDLPRAAALVRAGHAMATAAPPGWAEGNQPDFFLAAVLGWAEEPRAAEQAVVHGLARCEDLGMGWARASLHAVQAGLDIRSGRWDDADAHLDTALAFAQDLEVEHGVPWCLAQRAHLQIGRGLDPAPTLAQAEASVRRLGGQGAELVLWMRGLNHLTHGRHAEAAHVLGFLWGRLDAAGMVLRQVQLAPDLVRAAGVADPDRLAVVVARLEDVAKRGGGAQGAGWPRATAALTHARGIQAGVGVVVSQAAAIMAGLDDPLGAARMHVDAARLLPGPEGDADRRRASEILAYAGATAWLPAGAAATAPARGRRDAWDELTPSQARIVGLLGQGLSNQAIATRLSVSRRTVESHLYHAYAKLGVGSRVELGVQAAARLQQGWQPPA